MPDDLTEDMERILEYIMKDATMTRRHFEFVAAVINSIDLSNLGIACGKEAASELRLQIARDFARAFEGCNRAFKRDMFINAATKRDLRTHREVHGAQDAVPLTGSGIPPVSKTDIPSGLAETYAMGDFAKLTKRAATRNEIPEFNLAHKRWKGA